MRVRVAILIKKFLLLPTTKRTTLLTKYIPEEVEECITQ